MIDLDEMMGFLITTGQVDDTFGLIKDSDKDQNDDDNDDDDDK